MSWILDLKQFSHNVGKQSFFKSHAAGKYTETEERMLLASVHFMAVFSFYSFYTPWKHQINIGFLIFSEGTEKNQCHEIGQEEIKVNTLTHVFPMHTFSTPWKHQKTFLFFHVFRR